jgi:hypothetical protein
MPPEATAATFESELVQEGELARTTPRESIATQFRPVFAPSSIETEVGVS